MVLHGCGQDWSLRPGLTLCRVLKCMLDKYCMYGDRKLLFFHKEADAIGRTKQKHQQYYPNVSDKYGWLQN